MKTRPQDKKPQPTRQVLCRPLALAIALAFTGATLQTAQAATFTVTNTLDTGPGSLRRAVFDANNAAGDDVIIFDPSLENSKITLTSGEIAIGSSTSNDALTITGLNPDKPNSIIIDAGGNSRIFNTDAQSGMLLTLENITLTGGTADKGGAIQGNYTTLILNDTVITGNSSTSRGGGIFSPLKNITLNRSVISNNHSPGTFGGGGISSHSNTITLNDSVVSGNSAHNGGGIRGATVVLNQSTVSGNAATDATVGSGGGIRSGRLELYQSTLSGNTSTVGGAAWHDPATAGSTSVIVESTITNNTSTSGSGIYMRYGAGKEYLTLENTILSGNTGPNGNMHGVSSGPQTLTVNATHSLFGDPAAEISGSSTGVYFSNAPDLGPLQSNGGITETQRPNAYSPAVNSGSNTDTNEPYDQRGSGFARIQNVTVDMGSVERQLVTVSSNNEVLKRRDMVKELINAKFSLQPNNFSTGLEYQDVQARDINARWIEKFKTELLTEGCDTNKFCPDMVVTKEQMAKAFYNTFYFGTTPPLPSGNTFADVPQGSFAAVEITVLRDQGFTTGCDTNKFCPKQAVTKEWFDFLLNEF